jgi:iron complex outermembrane recepter protein
MRLSTYTPFTFKVKPNEITMKKSLLMLALLMLTFRAWTQFNISGQVTIADDGQPLPAAHIEILHTSYHAVSDDQGNFTIRNLKKGNYNLKISFIGYSTNFTPINLDKDVILKVKLQESPILADEVIISSTRANSKTPVTFQDISRETIEKSNFGQDLPVLLAGSISTVATSDAGNGLGYTALRIRGTDMTRINVTVNGIPLNDPESHNVFWVDLPDIASSTDNIQVQRGIGTSTNGASAFGASINLQSTRLNTTAYGGLSSSYGSFRTMKNSVSFGSGLINNHWTLDGRISGLSSDGYIDRASSSLSSYFFSTAFVDKKNLLRFNYFTGKEKTYQAWDGIPHEILDTNRRYNGMGIYWDSEGKRKFYDNETDNYNQTHYQLIISRQLTSIAFLNLAAHYTHGEGYYEQFREDDDLENYGIPAVILPGDYYLLNGDSIFIPDSIISSCDLVRRKWLDNDFAGITVSINWNPGKLEMSLGGSWNAYTGRHFGKVIWSQIGLGTEPDLEWYRSKGNKKDFNLYGKANYSLSRSLSLFGDLQLRRIHYGINGIDDDSRNITQSHHFTFFNPKTGLFWKLNASNSAYLSVALAKREPNRDNFVDADPGKPSPKPETLYDLEAGHHLQKPNFALSTNFYYMYYTDQLALTGAINDVGAPVMENVPQSYRLGLELAAEYTITHYLNWNASLTLSRNKVQKFTEYVDDWDTWSQVSMQHENTTLAFSPSIIANNELSFSPIPKGSITLVTRYIGKQYLDNTQDESRKLDPYIVNDIRFSYTVSSRIFKELTFRLSFNNVLNEKYESNAWVYRYLEGGEYKVLDGYFPQAEFNFMTGITLKI